MWSKGQILYNCVILLTYCVNIIIIISYMISFLLSFRICLSSNICPNIYFLTDRQKVTQNIGDTVISHHILIGVKPKDGRVRRACFSISIFSSRRRVHSKRAHADLTHVSSATQMLFPSELNVCLYFIYFPLSLFLLTWTDSIR